MPFSNFVDLSKYRNEVKTVPVNVNEAWKRAHEEIINSRKDYDIIKEIMRLGIPDDLRGTVWCDLLQVENVNALERNYGERLDKIFGGSDRVPKTIRPPSFGLPITSEPLQFAEKFLFLNARGLEVFRNTLCIIGHDHPNLLFCPFIPPIIAILVHQMSAYDALGSFLSLLQRSESKFKHRSMMTVGPVISLTSTPSTSPTSGKKLSIDGGEDQNAQDYQISEVSEGNPINDVNEISEAAPGNNLLLINTNNMNAMRSDNDSTPKSSATVGVVSFSPNSIASAASALSLNQSNSNLALKIREGCWGYFPYLRSSVYVFSLTFLELVNRFCSKVSKHIRSRLKLSEEEECLLFIPLLSQFYIGILPFNYVLRIFDMYIYEGYKILFRFGIAWLIKHKDELLKTTSKSEFEHVLHRKREAFNQREFESWFRVAFKEITFTRAVTETLHLRYMVERKAFFDKMDFHLQHLHANADDPDAHLNPSVGVIGGSFIPVPKVIGPRKSDFITPDGWYFLWSKVPNRYRLHDLELIFSAKTDGYFLRNLYASAAEKEPLFLVIETMDGFELGAYLPDALSKGDAKRFIGNGETFVFSLEPKLSFYPWVGSPYRRDANGNKRQEPIFQTSEEMEKCSYFILANPDFLAIGGGGAGYAIYLNSTLTQVSSHRCSTFDNEPFTPVEGKSFEVAGVELYRFCHS